METYNLREAGKRQVNLQAPQHGETRAAGETRPARSAARHLAQTERAVMHPDSNDLEWHYCLKGWAG
jgi:hypothetical protein